MQPHTRSLPLFPLEAVVLFPGMPLQLHVFEERYKAMVAACEASDRLFGVVLIRSGREVGAPAETEEIGCTARIEEIERLPGGRMNLLAVGQHRFRLENEPTVSESGYLVGEAALTLIEPAPADVPGELIRDVVHLLDAYGDLLKRLVGRTVVAEDAALSDTDPVALSFALGAALHVSPRERQQLLELDDAVARLTAEQLLLQREVSRLKQEAKLAGLVRNSTGSDKSIGPFSVN